MNAAATAVLKEIPDIKFGYGISDEFRWGFQITQTGLEKLSIPALYSIGQVGCLTGERGALLEFEGEWSILSFSF